MLLFSMVLFLISFSVGVAFTSNVPKVKVESVTYTGSVFESWSGDEIFAFRGIRFAEPPVGELRFKDPKPLKYNTSLEYDATKDGSDCPSIYANNPSEDCLVLNIYSRNILPTEKADFLHPVIAFIHPGGLYIGSSSSKYHNPEYLLTEDVILVTFNYRLGTLGFLNLGTKDIPGNAGFKDQVIALRWIQENISNFGGNPNAVTLMGYSAGALSVSLHLVSPMSQGLFQNAIIMSGSVPPQTKFEKDQKQLALKQANLMGCDVSEKEQIIECLNKFSGTEIASTLRSMFHFGKDNPVFLWLPVLEDDFGQERFLVEDPYRLLQRGDFNKIPLLIGFTSNELCTSAAEIIQNQSLLDNFNGNFSKLAPMCFMYSNQQDTQSINERLKENYLGGKPASMENLSGLCDLFSDSLIRFGCHRLSQLASIHVPVYAYKFSYLGRHTNLNFPGGPKGAEHMDDLMYLLPSKEIKFSQTDPEAVVVKTMINLIVTFAKTGIPPQPNTDLKWNYTANTYAEIRENIEIRKGTNFDRSEIWNDIFPIQSGEF